MRDVATLLQDKNSCGHVIHLATGSTAEPSGVPPLPAGFKPTPGGLMFQHAIMNLPASAVEFLDAFNGAFDRGSWRGRLPLVHVYTFKKSAETDQGERLRCL